MGFMNNRLTQMMKVDGGAPVEEEKEKEKKSGAVTGAVSSFLAAMQNMPNATGQKASLGAGGVAGDTKTNAYIDAIQNMTGQTEERRAITADGDIDIPSQTSVSPVVPKENSGKLWPGAVSVAGNSSVATPTITPTTPPTTMPNKTVVKDEEKAITADGDVGGTVQPTVPKNTTPSEDGTGGNSKPWTGATSVVDNVPKDKAWPGATPVTGTGAVGEDKKTPVEGGSSLTGEGVSGEGTDKGSSAVDPENDKAPSTVEPENDKAPSAVEPETDKKVTVPKVQASMDGASEYGEFLKNYGSDTGRNFAQAVRAANDDYYRALMTYGKNAEALAGNGLTGAGVSDYGSSAAYAARQGAVAVAGAAKQQADAENARSYAEYLQNYRAQQEAAAKEKNAGRTNTFNAILTQGITDPEVAKTLLRQSGYFSEEEVESLGGQAAAYSATQVQNAKDEATSAQNATNNAAKTNIYNSLLQQGLTDVNVIASQLRMSGLFTEEEIAQYSGEIAGAAKTQQDAEESAKDGANEQAAQDAYNSALANGASPSEAKTYIESQFGKDVAEQVAENAGAMVAASFEDSLKVAESSSTYTPFAQDNVLNKAVLDQQLATGMISQEQYNGYLTRVQALNEKWILDILNDAHDDYNFADACAALGITVENEHDAMSYGAAAVEGLREVVRNLYKSGDIDRTQMAAYVAKDFDHEYEAIMEDGGVKGVRDIAGQLLRVQEYAESVGDEEIYNDLLAKVARNLSISANGYQITFKGEKDQLTTITLKTVEIPFSVVLQDSQKVDKSDLTEIHIGDDKLNTAKYAVDSKGNLYINPMLGGWKQIDLDKTQGEKSSGVSPDQAQVLVDILKILVPEIS